MVPGIDYVLQAVDTVFAVAFATLVCACSAGATTAPAGGEPLENAPPPGLQEAQEAACHRVAPKVTDCAIQDARTTMPPEKFAEMARDLDELAARNTEQFLSRCIASDMSPRQVEVYETCPLDASCARFLSCTDRATPRR